MYLLTQAKDMAMWVQIAPITLHHFCTYHSALTLGLNQGIPLKTYDLGPEKIYMWIWLLNLSQREHKWSVERDRAGKGGKNTHTERETDRAAAATTTSSSYRICWDLMFWRQAGRPPSAWPSPTPTRHRHRHTEESLCAESTLFLRSKEEKQQIHRDRERDAQREKYTPVVTLISRRL